MGEFRLKFDAGEFELAGGVTSLGRTSDNDVSFPDDSNVSRFHAEIEERSGEFCLIDLNSSNGTTVNGERVSGERYLKPGDVIVLGGSSRLVFGDEAGKAEEPAPAEDVVDEPSVGAAPTPPASAAPPVSVPPAEVAAGSRHLLLIAAGAILIAVVVVGVAGAVYYRSSVAACTATAKILKPEDGDTIIKPVEIELQLENAECVARAVYTLDGIEFAEGTAPDFMVTLDPADHPELSDGLGRSLSVILVDEEGKTIPSEASVQVFPETRNTKPVEKPDITGVDSPDAPEKPKKAEATLMEVQEMTVGLARRFPGSGKYNLSSRQLLTEVQKRTSDFAREGTFQTASRYRDTIDAAFVRDKNLEASIGYLLALSRSKFDPKKQGSEEGLWRMDPEFAKANGYDGVCGGQPIADPSQTCAALVAAEYTKVLVEKVFEGDVILAVAAFGRSSSDATAWKAGLPAGRGIDVWNAIRTAPERERVVNFLAAALVAENPQKFGLANEQPLSRLYRQQS
ncbi:MAG: FHA domain-containing protein [Chloracidobacterium sp.]|nr:FHA domain-containing protein [Chloracidobacterium sp.]